MSIFIGGDTASLDYSFDLAVAGDSSYPMKIYRSINGIDVNSPDPPTLGGVVDATKWSWIQDSRTLDKLKAQNEIPITSTDFANRTAVWNGKNLVLQSDTQPSVRDDFAGKIAGDTTANANIYKHNYANNDTTLRVPSSFVSEGTYNQIVTQNGSSDSITKSVVNTIPQQLFQFNIIRMLEDKFGALPCPNDLASKVAWITNNVLISPNWVGYGVGPLGNKAYLKIAITNDTSYSSGSSNATSSPTALGWSRLPLTSGYLNNNGFVNLLAFTDAARTTDSTLLVLSGHGLNTWDFIENTTRGIFKQINLVTQNTAQFSGIVSTQTAGDSIRKYHQKASNVVVGNVSGSTVTLNNHGLNTGDMILNSTRGNLCSEITVVDANTFTVNTPISGMATGDTIATCSYFGTQTAESTVIPSTIYTDYISLDIQLKSVAGYDLLVPSNPRRDSVTNGNYDNIVMAEKVYNSLTSDYTGKISGDLSSNPNIVYCRGNGYLGELTTLAIPNVTSMYELSTAHIGNIKTLNGVLEDVGAITSGGIPQQLFQFNLISIFEKQYGTIPATDKVGWLKANLSSIKVDWYGYGSCPSGNKAYLSRWDSTAWRTPTNTQGVDYNGTSSVVDCALGPFASSYIQSDGFINFLAYTDASDGVTASTIYTDYIKLTLSFNNGNNSIEYFTNNSVEIAVQTTGKASSNMISVDTTPVCNALYGASNSALLSAFKTTSSFDIYAQGYGANSNDIVNGVNYFAWNGTSWISLGSNLTNVINKVTCTLNNSNFIQSNNQIYLMVTSKYNASTDVPSVVNLDYCKLTISLNRTPDVISPITIIL